MKYPKVGAIVRCDWIDAVCDYEGKWQYHDDVCHDLKKITTVGRLYANMVESITIIGSWSDDEVSEVVVIPKVCVKKIKAIQ